MRKSTAILIALFLIAQIGTIAYAQGVYLPLVSGTDSSQEVSAAAAQFVDVAAGDTLTVHCLGPRLRSSRVDGVTFSLACDPLPATATSTATNTPAPNTQTPTPVATPTNTPIPPTGTNTPISPTNTPVATPTEAQGNIQPYAAGPLCPTHDPTTYHGLWDYVRGCHYTHTHNADPSDPAIVAVFGPAAPWGQTISYPWETMGATDTENHLKHEGYKWLTVASLPLGDNSVNWSCCGNNYIVAVRIEHHRLGGPADLTVRLHSFYEEVKVCTTQAKTQCGIARFGGWSDYGILHSPYKTSRVLLPADGPYPNNYDLNLDPYRSSRPFADAVVIGTNPSANCRGCGQQFTDNTRDIWSLWTTSPFSADGYNRIGGSFTIVHDDWQGIDAINPSRQQPIGGRFNNTEAQPFTLWVNVPTGLDTDHDGFVTFAGYTDVKGNIVQGCTAPGANCVPLVFDHAPVGMAAWTTPTNNGKDTGVMWRDYDLTPANIPSWIQYPN